MSKDDILQLEPVEAALLIEDWLATPYADFKIYMDNLVWRLLKDPVFNREVSNVCSEWDVIRFCYLRYGLSGVRGMKRQNRIKSVRTERRRARRS